VLLLAAEAVGCGFWLAAWRSDHGLRDSLDNT